MFLIPFGLQRSALHYAWRVAVVVVIVCQISSGQNREQERRLGRDWPMWGGGQSRNMVAEGVKISLEFAPPCKGTPGKNLLWSAPLGSQSYGPPTVAAGKVFIGTNNGSEYRPHHKGDRGCFLCFREDEGKFLWQLTREKLATGRVNDWPLQGIVSRACVEGDRLWVVTNRAELMCLDMEGFYDGVNDGPYRHEVDHELEDADIVWSLDMINELDVYPHNLACSSPVVLDELVYVITSNGMDESHRKVASPSAPAFLAVNKITGEVTWSDNSPLDNILHGQWSSPTIGFANGQHQVYMAGGDGWLYAFDDDMGNLIWKFDLNPKESKWELGGRGNRNEVLATPVFIDQSVVIAVGQDPEHGGGVGYLYRIDATKSGDISFQTPDGKHNPNSGMIWRYGGLDEDGSVTGKVGQEIFRRTLATAAIHDGLVYAADLTGYLHCIDFETGKRQWEYDTQSAQWGGPMVADGKVFIGNEEGSLIIMKAGRKIELLDTKVFPSSIYGHPVIANEKIFVTDRSRLFVFRAQ